MPFATVKVLIAWSRQSFDNFLIGPMALLGADGF